MVRVSEHVFDSVEFTACFGMKDLPAAAMGRDRCRIENDHRG